MRFRLLCPVGVESQGAGLHLRLQRIFPMCLSAWWVLVCRSSAHVPSAVLPSVWNPHGKQQLASIREANWLRTDRSLWAWVGFGVPGPIGRRRVSQMLICLQLDSEVCRGIPGTVFNLDERQLFWLRTGLSSPSE